MTKTIVRGGRQNLENAIDDILAGGTPVINHVIRAEAGYWIILHSAS